MIECTNYKPIEIYPLIIHYKIAEIYPTPPPPPDLQQHQCLYRRGNFSLSKQVSLSMEGGLMGHTRYWLCIVEYKS